MLKIFGNTGISLFRAIQCTKYNLETRTVDYWLGHNSLYVLADRKKESLGKPQRRRKRKNHLKIISRLLKNIICAKCVPIMPEWKPAVWRQQETKRHDLHATTKQVISSRLLEENGREMC